jgi:flagellar FliL protein
MAEQGSAETEGEAPPKKKGKLLLIAIPVLLVAVVAGLWFTGILPGLLGMNKKPVKPTGESKPPVAAAAPPTYVDVPAVLANLNVPGKRPSYLKLHAKLELASKSDEAGVTAAMPRILDLFQTYLRDMRPEELRGAEGTYRLREELIARATVAAAPARVADVLFVEMIVE